MTAVQRLHGQSNVGIAAGCNVGRLLLITTEAMVAEKPEPKGGGMLAGMGGLGAMGMEMLSTPHGWTKRAAAGARHGKQKRAAIGGPWSFDVRNPVHVFLRRRISPRPRSDSSATAINATEEGSGANT